jgi:diguanylate cyclase (GGDEF)-like protein
MADIDHFKKINDAHGHPAGDRVLRTVADTVERVVRGKGVAYRYGGEEFALLLPNHSSDEAIALAERARLAIEALVISGLRVTMSFGLAAVPSQGTSSEDWLKKADSALYDAKQHGRNVVRVFGEPPPAADQPKQRRPARKVPQPGELSDDDKERLRRTILKYAGAYCPSCKDDIPLSVHDVTSLGESGKSFLVHCPACGFDTDLPGPGR